MDLLDRMETAAHAAIQFIITETVERAEDISAKEVTYYDTITLA